ncbi:MAG: YebC/PmpR family DNA-binding transcriptional regulator [Bacteroidetes bacterium]|nr:YebC/PmpR family DNA-binding transcriptional regulator [Bacteroidota bacterium]
MGRAFEFRKERKFRRWNAMAKTFTKIGREIAISVKNGGPDPATNPRLRVAIQNAKGANMPKDRIENAIKRVTEKDAKDFDEVVYEGYGPHAIAIVVETATDNTARTVANVRVLLNKAGGSLGKTGSLDYMFVRKGLFKISTEGVNLDDLELELIDAGLEEIQNYPEENMAFLYSAFSDFGTMAKALEENKLSVISAELQRIPSTTTELSEAEAEDVINLIEKLEDP